MAEVTPPQLQVLPQVSNIPVPPQVSSPEWGRAFLQFEQLQMQRRQLAQRDRALDIQEEQAVTRNQLMRSRLDFQLKQEERLERQGRLNNFIQFQNLMKGQKDLMSLNLPPHLKAREQDLQRQYGVTLEDQMSAMDRDLDGFMELQRSMTEYTRDPQFQELIPQSMEYSRLAQVLQNPKGAYSETQVEDAQAAFDSILDPGIQQYQNAAGDQISPLAYFQPPVDAGTRLDNEYKYWRNANERLKYEEALREESEAREAIANRPPVPDTIADTVDWTDPRQVRMYKGIEDMVRTTGIDAYSDTGFQTQARMMIALAGQDPEKDIENGAPVLGSDLMPQYAEKASQEATGYMISNPNLEIQIPLSSDGTQRDNAFQGHLSELYTDSTKSNSRKAVQFVEDTGEVVQRRDANGITQNYRRIRVNLFEDVTKGFQNMTTGEVVREEAETIMNRDDMQVKGQGMVLGLQEHSAEQANALTGSKTFDKNSRKIVSYNAYMYVPETDSHSAEAEAYEQFVNYFARPYGATLAGSIEQSFEESRGQSTQDPSVFGVRRDQYGNIIGAVGIMEKSDGTYAVQKYNHQYLPDGPEISGLNRSDMYGLVGKEILQYQTMFTVSNPDAALNPSAPATMSITNPSDLPPPMRDPYDTERYPIAQKHFKTDNPELPGGTTAQEKMDSMRTAHGDIRKFYNELAPQADYEFVTETIRSTESPYYQEGTMHAGDDNISTYAMDLRTDAPVIQRLKDIYFDKRGRLTQAGKQYFGARNLYAIIENMGQANEHMHVQVINR